LFQTRIERDRPEAPADHLVRAGFW
jgi:hypothetical protein